MTATTKAPTADDIIHEGSTPATCSCEACVVARVDAYLAIGNASKGGA